MTRDDLIYEFLEALQSLSRASSYLANDDLGLEEFLILDIVSENENCSMKDIINGLSIAASTATGIVDRLVARGFVERGHSKSDRRKVLIHMTPTGMAAYDRFRSEALESVRSTLEQLTDDEIRSVLVVIKKILPTVKR